MHEEYRQECPRCQTTTSITHTYCPNCGLEIGPGAANE